MKKSCHPLFHCFFVFCCFFLCFIHRQVFLGQEPLVLLRPFEWINPRLIFRSANPRNVDWVTLCDTGILRFFPPSCFFLNYHWPRSWTTIVTIMIIGVCETWATKWTSMSTDLTAWTKRTTALIILGVAIAWSLGAVPSTSIPNHHDGDTFASTSMTGSTVQNVTQNATHLDPMNLVVKMLEHLCHILGMSLKVSVHFEWIGSKRIVGWGLSEFIHQ